MDEKKIDEIIELFKMDLGIKNNSRNEYYKNLILSSFSELERKGILLNESIEDMMLISDYAAWNYRNRTEGKEGIPKNLILRIRNRIMTQLSKKGESNE